MAITKHHAVILTSVAVAVLLGVGVWLRPSQRIAPEGHLPPPSGMPAAAQQVLRQRMERHGADMGALISAVVLLDFRRSEELARRIASDANLARPLSGDATELNALLPGGFFDIQAELKTRALRLADAAQRGDTQVLVEAYTEVSRTCLNCHLLYARPR